MTVTMATLLLVSVGKNLIHLEEVPPDGEDPDGGHDAEITEIKISRREADKVIVPSFPTATHLIGCLNVLQMSLAHVRIRARKSGWDG